MTPAEGEVAVRVVVRGRVQGVGFRAWARGQAELHDLSGWVRNLAGGAVEAVLVGPPERIELMVKACREGPAGARVDEVAEYPADPADLADLAAGFAQRPSA